MSAWAKPGAWALDCEEHEAELVPQKIDDFHSNANANANAKANASGDYPTLAAAAATKTKKKKGQTLSLQDFTAYGTTAKQPPSQANKGLTPDELLSLPTGPRQRSAEELERSKGFRSYGTRDEQPRRQRDSNRDFAPPSRADEIDDWGAAKKFTAPNSFERRERREGGGGFFSDSQSRADEVDNWASSKTFVPSEGRRNERRGVFDSNGSGGADSDNWAKRKEEEGRKIGSLGGSFDSLRERRGGSFESSNGGGSVDSDNWGKKREESGGRPRLNLQPRTLPLGDGQQQNNESLVKPKGTSPFGEARPREEVLKEKGQDWKEIEEKLESEKIKETGEERPPAFGKRGFGSGNWRGSLQEDRIERAWRKPAEIVDARPR